MNTLLSDSSRTVRLIARKQGSPVLFYFGTTTSNVASTRLSKPISPVV